MLKYHKIDTIFKRDPKTKKFINNCYTNPTIEFLKDNKWIFTEKINGTNTRVYWDGYNIHFGGRTDDSEIPLALLTRLNQLFNGPVNEVLFEQKFGEKEVFLFGEGFGGNIQNKKDNIYQKDTDFILFDVMINGNYQPREVVEDIANYFNIKVVPILCVGTLADGIEYVKNNKKSTIAQGEAVLEGLVGRTAMETFDRCGNRNIVKIKWSDIKDLQN